MFEVPQLVFDTYKQAVDAMIDFNFGVRCTIYYPEEPIKCINCNYDSLNNRSSNQYNGTGPIAFSNSICPYCNGDGVTKQSNTEDIMLRCYFSPKQWIKIPVSVNIADAALQTYGHIADLPKCRRALYLVANTDEGNFIDYRFQMFGEPSLHGFKKNQYFVCYWSRIK